MPDKISAVAGMWGGLVLLLILQAAWSRFAAYPMEFEARLRRGRTWVYMPLRWKGFRRLRVMAVSRLLLLAVAALAAFLFAHHTGRRQFLWLAAVAAAAYALAAWLQAFWTGLRYRQQEDVYYRLHDELRSRLEQENKDYTDTQLRNLAAYQHQQRLRAADEEGRFLSFLGSEARRARKTPRPEAAAPPEE